MIGLSTAWLTERSGLTGREVIKRIISLGFCAVELDYRVTETDGERFLLSSPDREQRECAVKNTIRTLESAKDLGALAVVLHLGKVEMDPEYDRLHELLHQNMLDLPEGRRFRQVKVKERQEKRHRYLENVLASLDRLNKEAEKRGVLLGIENRYRYHQIPDFEEIGIILERFSGGQVAYWHDVGHAHVLEKLGFMEPGALLRSYGLNLLGTHLHDARGIDDHWAPGTGEIDFLALRDCLRSARIKILEVHKKSDGSEVLEGRRMLERIGLI